MDTTGPCCLRAPDGEHPRLLCACILTLRYPSGSVVGFSLDEKGRPLFAFSSMSAHTGDLAADSRVSLTVTSASFKVT